MVTSPHADRLNNIWRSELSRYVSGKWGQIRRKAQPFCLRSSHQAHAGAYVLPQQTARIHLQLARLVFEIENIG